MSRTSEAAAGTPVNVICLKWGTRYGVHYVNNLAAGVTRHLRRPHQIHCVTDDPRGLGADVRPIPFPDNPGVRRGWPDILVKLLLMADGFGGLKGPTLFLDLDVVIMAGLDVFFDYHPGEYCMIHNWSAGSRALLGHRPPIGNSSVFRFEAGGSQAVVDTFLDQIAEAEDRSVYNTEQAFMTHAMGQVTWWPDSWVRSYKRHCRPLFPLNHLRTPRPPRDCRVLVFHGVPDPDQAIQGFRGRKPHHGCRPAPWIQDHWPLPSDHE
ncbi:MAG: hypothetical protein AB1Z21_08580 [Synechococcaceae cyanobacterium]